MRIPKDVIVIWNGTNASIPSGFTRETALDGRFPKAWGTEAVNTEGGSATHTHTSSSHTHSIDTHSHTIQTTTNSHSGGDTGDSDGHIEQNTKNGNHYHTGTISTLTSTSVSSTAVTYAAASNNPPYHEVIFIKSQGGALATGIITLWNSSSIPTDYLFCDGLNGTPDLKNKYLRGAATGQDAGDTGGSTTNTHDISHSHSVSHGHSGTTGSPVGGSDNRNTGSGSSAGVSWLAHTHPITLNSTAETITNTISLVTTETVEPTYYKLNPIYNNGTSRLPLETIALWLGSPTAIPSGWKVCDGTNGTPDLQDKFIKMSNSAAEVGDTGGSNTHTHAAQAHTHTASATHTHTGTVGASGNDEDPDGGGHSYWQPQATPHTLSSVSSSTTTLASANTSANSSDNQPEYTTVVYIQLKQYLSPALAFFGML